MVRPTKTMVYNLKVENHSIIEQDGWFLNENILTVTNVNLIFVKTGIKLSCFRSLRYSHSEYT